MPNQSQKIINSWHKNAKPWTIAVRGNQIRSRKMVTNQAIIDAVMTRKPNTVLDIGCGEGWLCRQLSVRKVKVTGIDIVPELINAAKASGGGDFRLLSYEELAAGQLQQSFDIAVCNFSLIGKESVENLFAGMSHLLKPDGSLIVQTLHPVFANGESTYEDGWREGSWTGFSDAFTDPAPWYFRTIASWTKLFVDHGLAIEYLLEPYYAETGKAGSLILIGKSSKNGN